MRHFPCHLSSVAAGLALLAPAMSAQAAPAAATMTSGPYHVKQTAKVGGAGGFDSVYADTDGRKLYVARSGPAPRVSVFNLDTLAPAGAIPQSGAHGAATDTLSHHGFASSSPDCILADSFDHRVYVFSHSAPNVSVLNAADGAVGRHHRPGRGARAGRFGRQGPPLH